MPEGSPPKPNLDGYANQAYLQRKLFREHRERVGSKRYPSIGRLCKFKLKDGYQCGNYSDI